MAFALTLKGLAHRRTLSGFKFISIRYPGLSLRSNPGLKLANAFGVKTNDSKARQLLGAFSGKRQRTQLPSRN